jgi:outer membrane protein OmpA-like peptidoglycan-associated protein
MALATLLTVPAAMAQPRDTRNEIRQGQLSHLDQARMEVRNAEQAGARTLAPTLFDDAQARLRSAESMWDDKKSSNRDMAVLRSDEAFWAARAARAKAQWLGNVGTARNLQTDIRHFGGTSDVTMLDEPMTNEFRRGTTSRMRIAYAQGVLDETKRAGADQVPNNDLVPAQENLNTARKIATNDNSSDAADHLAFVAEMMARRAYYMLRVMETTKYLPNLQLERTRLAQAASEQAAAAERRQREESERHAAELQAQLQAEAANRQAQQSELESLRAQLAESQRQLAARVDEDRAARARAEAALDQAYATYQSALAGGAASSSSDVDTLRRQLEDQQIALRAVQERERLNEQAMSTEIERLRTDLATQQQNGADAQAVADRQAELTRRQQQLEAMRADRERDLAARADVERQQQAALADAQHRREEAEAQANVARQETTAAQATAQQAQLLAQQAQSQAQSTQNELNRTREQLADKDVQLRRRELQSDLTRIVTTTRSDERGIIVTLGGTYFDSGKTALKAGGKATLDRIATSLKNNANATVLVEGHTDNVGGTEMNLRLSEKRAAAVRDYLVSKGVPEARITSSGKGESAPVATNKTAAGRQQNRRVELVISM